ncbi:MAG: ABC transporter ATP-binding protein [Clostridiaceae bacterium]|nr:ABC transporter ATP-binding protein [Clostridiaceae bacterium]
MDKMQSNANASIGRGNVGGGGRGRPVQKPHDFAGTMKMLWQALSGLRGQLAVVCGIALIISGASVIIPLISGAAIDACGTGPGEVIFPVLRNFVILLAVAYGVDVGLIFLREFLMAGLSQSFVNRLRRDLFAKLQKLPLWFFDSHESGDLMSRLTNDMDTISGSVGQAAIQLVTGVLTVSGTLVAMIFKSPILACTVLVTVPLIYLLTRIVTKRTGPLFKKQQAVLGMLNSHIEETITGVETVRAYGKEDMVARQFEEQNDLLRRVGTSAHVWSSSIMPLLNVINNFGFVLVSAVGGVLALRGSITLGTIAAFVSLTKQFVRPLNEIANTYNTFLSAIAGAERVFDVMNEPEEIADRPAAVALSEASGGASVEFSHVSFGYRPDTEILHDVSFTVPARTRAAFVGPTGAGKTTIINLLTRFYDVTGGAILVDGCDLRDYTRDSVRSTFGVVLQETYLFGGTILDNIRYGKLDATDEEVREAARIAGADRFITRLHNGYSTVVADNGGNLSAGQRQLLALARAVLSDPPILILDEATSSVDTRTELRIQRIMASLMENRTTFVIAHRLGTIRDADCIFVVDHGEIVERGNHTELMEKRGTYYQMYTSQFGIDS